jgi:hypothetical protein
MGAHPFRHLHSSDGVVYEQVESGSELAKPQYRPRKTKLDITFKVKYKIANAPTKEKDTKRTNEVWDKYVAALERDYVRRR